MLSTTYVLHQILVPLWGVKRCQEDGEGNHFVDKKSYTAAAIKWKLEVKVKTPAAVVHSQSPSMMAKNCG